MAKEKNGGESSAKKGSSKKHDEHAGAGHEAKAAKSVPAPAGHDDSHAKAVGHGGHTVDRKEYWKIFVVLFVLTVLEVVLAQLPGIGKMALGVGLVGLAVTKAACVGLYYMHLKHETKILKMTVAIPMATPAFYAFVLIAEAAWRGLR